ncbi:MAG: glycosyltransferase family 2 protein [Thermoproteus sp.]|jgi:cellulose synthase/poly-beta-1,6-N-acetylglucosamine synthase-like glycosyltransferase|uniref:glycosyltransferase family 2 protein n=1 Tax=Thermoproteus sp. CP80 TaxID=1650659 RepID=UPI001EDE25B7|nr:glycosyltransferase family 2 protein [Thermoproteus sp. CP80]
MIFLVLLAIGAVTATWHLVTTFLSSEGQANGVYDDDDDGVYVVMPSCRDENLFETLPKWLTQNYRNYKVAVIEDCGDMGLVEPYKLKPSGIVRTPRPLRVFSNEQLILFMREGRFGLKGGALNDAIRGLMSLKPLRNPKYVIFVDSDHEPPDFDFIRRAVSTIKRLGVDLVQGVQRHLYLGSSLDALVSVSHDISGTMLVGRTRLNMMPIFTGSTAIARLEPIVKLWFSEDTVTEDLDLSVRMWLNGYSIAATWGLYTWGRPPRNLKSYFKQQLRWASGTIKVFLRYLVPVIKSDIPMARKIDFFFQGTVFATSSVYVAIIVLLIYRLVMGPQLTVPEIVLLLYLFSAGLAIDIYVESKYHTPTRPDILAPFLELVTAFVHIAGTALGIMGREYGWVRTQRKLASAVR